MFFSLIKSMKILFYLTRYPGVGGIENVTNAIAEQLMEQHEISIISHMQQECASKLNGVICHCMPNSQRWTARENYEYADQLVADNNYDAIIYQDSYAPTETVVCTIAKKNNVPLYVFEHNSPLFVYNKRSLEPIITPKGFLRSVLHTFILRKEIKRKRYLLEHSTKYVLLSKQFIPEFCKLIGVDCTDERITYINNPTTAVPEQAVGQKENVILCVSRLAKEKCVDKMVEMWSELAAKLPEWKFMIVGEGTERSRLEAMVKQNLIPRIDFIGFAKPTEYYLKAKIFWMTSKYEGWGLTLLEAMQQRCVPVAFKSFSSVFDIINDGDNGYLIEPTDKCTFIKKSLSLANDDKMRSCMAEAGLEVVSKYSIDKIVTQWEMLLNQA